jgi:hypothetical protein
MVTGVMVGIWIVRATTSRWCEPSNLRNDGCARPANYHPRPYVDLRSSALEVAMASKDRTVANKSEGEFEKMARAKTLSDSGVDESLDRMIGSSQQVVREGGRIRDKLRRKAIELNQA